MPGHGKKHNSGRSPSPPRLLQAALRYAKRGWAVFPLEPRGKRPLAGSRGHNDATTDPRTIRAWWAETPEANIGIALRPSGLVVLDVDGPDGHAVAESLQLPPTRRVRTGKKGYHLYFSAAGRSIGRKIGLRPHLDLLGDGYVVAPPSVHPATGKKYRLRTKQPVASVPDSVVALLEEHSPRAVGTEGTSDLIPEGSRDAALTSLAGSMRRRNAAPATVLAALRKENAKRCRPPLSDAQVKKIARSAERFSPAPLETPDTGWNDITVAARFAHQEASALRWCQGWKTWLIWDGRRWKPDSALEVQKRLKDHILGMLSLAEAERHDEARDKLLKSVRPFTRQLRLKSVEILARDRLVVQPSELDADPWMLNLLNGTLDLRSVRLVDGRLRARLLPHDPSRLIAALAPVAFDPRAECEEWFGFLTIVFRRNAELDWDDPLHSAEDDQALEWYAQELVGLSLTGDVRDDALPFAYGPGGSGKTTFMGTIQHLLGDYAVTIAFELLLQRQHGGDDHRDLPRLRGARAAFASEVAENRRWNIGMVKQLTGGDQQRARLLYGEAFEFEPTAKIWLRANDRPAAYDPSNGFWRRLRILPFDHGIPDDRQDKHLRARLRDPEALSGILNWALEGLVRWHQRGRLPEEQELPDRVRAANAEYQADQVDDDPLTPFFEECCDISKNRRTRWTSSGDLHKAMESWWHGRGRPHRSLPTQQSLGRSLRQRGLIEGRQRVGRRKVRGWHGIRLR